MATKLAAEDVRLGSSSIIGARTKLYKDIDLTFAAKPSGDIFKKTDAAAVKPVSYTHLTLPTKRIV